ncbi:MAG: hypothetical protein KIT48_04280 [Pseudolabrys sp.]|nr:hypothetical protein [Pseudolabrys sp.]
MVALVAVSPAHPIYDEAWFVATVRLFQRDGFSLTFLREFPGAAGPTFTVVFAGINDLFGLAFPWLRLVNVVLLVATALSLWRCLALTRPASQEPALTAATLIVLPTVGVAAGMALTEMTAAFFAIAGLALLTQAFTAPRSVAIAWCAASGLTLAAAILGRQNYLVLLPCLALAVRWHDGAPDRDQTWRVALVAIIAVVMVTPVFAVWGGLVPPRTAWSSSGLAPDNVVRGAGYAGIIVLLLTPAIYAPLLRRSWLPVVAAATAFPIAVALGRGLVPLRTTMSALFGERSLTFIAWATAYLLSFAALAFIGCFALHLWRHRDEWLTRMTGAAALLGLLSNAKITHQFSSRYVFVIVPLLLIAAAPAMRLTRWTPLQMTSAAGISLAALASYYWAG